MNSAAKPESESFLVILIAPNVSEQMGGEAMKALKLYENIKRQHSGTIQITHERCRAELSKTDMPDIYYVPDDWIARFLWKSMILRLFVNVWFSYRAVKLAESLADQSQNATERVYIHQTEPNSPVTIRSVSKRFKNLFGPINGNIYYPACFRNQEKLITTIRRLFHFPLQRINRILFPSLRKANLIFAAGGERTIASLLAAGVKPTRIVETIDFGISDQIFDRRAVDATHPSFQTNRLVHYGRIVFHKGTHLAIEAVALCAGRVHLDVIGRGPHLEYCKKLVGELQIEQYVHFHDWFPSHDMLLDRISTYAGFVLPSIEDANGIVVQEAMALGVPGICLNWGGPSLLVENGKNGYLIDVNSREQIVNDISRKMIEIVELVDQRQQMALRARRAAEAWRWSEFTNVILTNYSRLG